MANEKIVSQIKLPNGDIYDIAPPAITNDDIDAICGAAIYYENEVSV